MRLSAPGPRGARRGRRRPRAGAGARAAARRRTVLPVPRPPAPAPRRRSRRSIRRPTWPGSRTARSRASPSCSRATCGTTWRSPSVTSLKAGDPLTPAGTRAALRELLRRGRFARGRVSAQQDGGGALVTARVVPRKLIERLQVDLHGARLDVEELLRERRPRRGRRDRRRRPRRDDREPRAHLRAPRISRRQGAHPDARHRRRRRARSSSSTSSPGAPRFIGDRRFYVFGASPEAVAPITAVVRRRRQGPHRRARARPGRRRARAGAPRQGLVLAPASRTIWCGWCDRRRRPAASRHAARARRRRRRCCLPRFEGNEHYDADVLTAALGLDTETDRSPSHLADKVRAFYEKRGFLDVEVRAEVRGDEEPVKLLVFHIVEHPRVRVAGRRYPCLKLDAIRNLSAGGPRSPAAIGTEIDSFLEDELPGAELFVDPDPRGVEPRSARRPAQAGNAGAARRAARSRPRRDVRRRHLRPRRRARPGALSNEGFLHAQVGPIRVVRARCDPRSPPGRCVPLPLPAPRRDLHVRRRRACRSRPSRSTPALTCRPDPAHGVECAPAIAARHPRQARAADAPLGHRLHRREDDEREGRVARPRRCPSATP